MAWRRWLALSSHGRSIPHLHLVSSFSSSRFFCSDASPSARSSVGKNQFGRRVVHVLLLSLTGGFALSALNDLAIFHGCSRKAIEMACQNQEFIGALGEPVARGPWYAATLAVGHRRETVSCKFPVHGPKGSAILKIKAIRIGDDGWSSVLRHNDWDILISEAFLPDEQGQESRVIVINDIRQSGSYPGRGQDGKWRGSPGWRVERE
ncbi:cytochrome oxidase complex assembly protein [Wolffia australiana]